MGEQAVSRKEKARKDTDIFLLSQYCVKKQDYSICCTKSKIYKLLTLYFIISYEDWVSTKDVVNKLNIKKPRVLESLELFHRLGIVERKYIPSVQGVTALWRIKKEALNGYDKKYILELLAKHIKMCIEHSVAGAIQFSETA